MSRIKLSLAALVTMAAVLSISAIGAASASAAFTLETALCGTGLPTICWEKSATELAEFKGEEAFTGAKDPGTTSVLKAKFGTETVEVTCTASALAGTLKQTEPLVKTGSISGLVITFTGCSLKNPLGEHCSVPTELKTESSSGAVTDADPTNDLTFKPEVGEKFVAIKFNEVKECPVAILGTKNVTGTQLCTLENSSEDLLEHLITCLPAGSALKLGGNTAELTLETSVKLTNANDKWSLELG